MPAIKKLVNIVLDEYKCRGKHPQDEAGETEAEFGKRAELHFKHMVMRASEKLVMRAGLMQSSESATCISLCRRLANAFQAEETTSTCSLRQTCVQYM